MYNIDDWDYRKKLLIGSIGDDLLNHDKNGSINSQKKQYTESILENCYNYYGCDDKTIELNAKIFTRLLANELVGVQVSQSNHKIHNLRVSYGIPPSSYRMAINVFYEVVTPFLNDYDLSVNKDFGDDELVSKICDELDTKLIRTLIDAKPERQSIDTFDINKIRTMLGYNYVYDTGLMLSCLIKRQSTFIGVRTRRGCGNWCVLSPTAFNLLNTKDNVRFVKADFETFGAVRYVGLMDGGISVYCNYSAKDNDPIVVGYKGSNIDTGLYYIPSILLINNGSSYQKIDSYFSMKQDVERNCLHDMNDYYGYINI